MKRRLTPLKAIKAYCFECMGEIARLIKQCTNESCPLYPYREGHNPFHKGIGSKKKDPESGQFVKTEKIIHDKEVVIQGKYRLVKVEGDE